MSADKSAVEALADEWAANDDWAKHRVGYGEGRGDQLDLCEQQLRPAIAADRAAGRLVTPTEPSSSSGYGR